MVLRPCLCFSLALIRCQSLLAVRFLGLPGAVTHWRGQPSIPWRAAAAVHRCTTVGVASLSKHKENNASKHRLLGSYRRFGWRLRRRATGNNIDDYIPQVRPVRLARRATKQVRGAPASTNTSDSKDEAVHTNQLIATRSASDSWKEVCVRERKGIIARATEDSPLLHNIPRTKKPV